MPLVFWKQTSRLRKTCKEMLYITALKDKGKSAVVGKSRRRRCSCDTLSARLSRSSGAIAIEQQLPTHVPKGLLKHAITDYLVWGTDHFALRFSNKNNDNRQHNNSCLVRMNHSYTFCYQMGKKYTFLVCRRILVISLECPEVKTVENHSYRVGPHWGETSRLAPSLSSRCLAVIWEEFSS